MDDYLLGVFFALTHTMAGERGVLLNHRMRQNLADHLIMAGVAISGLIAGFIIVGLCGLRVWST